MTYSDMSSLSSSSLYSTPSAASSAAAGQAYLSQNQTDLINSLFPAGSVGIPNVTDTFSPSYLYQAVTTDAIAKADPTLFNIESASADALGLEIQSYVTSQILGSISSSLTSGVDVLGYLYASNGAISLLTSAPTSTFHLQA